jgi:hypothetical protein
MLSEISESTLLSLDSILTFLQPPRDQNITWFGGCLGKRYFGRLKDGIGEFSHHRIYRRKKSLLHFDKL